MRFYLLIFLFVSALSISAAEAPPDVSHRRDFVIGLSPYLEKSVKDEIYRSIVHLIVEDLPLDSTLTFYDAFELKSIARLTVPNARVFQSPKTRANQFAPAIQDLKRFLAQDHVKPAHLQMKFESAVRLPQFYQFVSDTLPGNDSAVTVLLIGSPLYEDAKEPGFSMIDGYFPSDAHLTAPWEKSVFGVRGDVHKLRPLRVHWVYFGDPWTSDLHKEKVTRFWTLFLEQRGGELASFSGDLPTAVQGFRQGAADSHSFAGRWSLEPQQTKIEMLRVGRSIELADWITRDALPQTAPLPPTVMVGPMKIGIRWKPNIDLDLYATPRPGRETLFFQHPRSPEGSYYKDHRTSPGREYEFIEFDSPVDVRQVEAFVNFYKGSCPGGPRGEVRIEFDGRIYSAPFLIPAAKGNQGRTGDEQQEFWFRIPVQEVLRIVSGSHAAG
jgi:hypothetical protein